MDYDENDLQSQNPHLAGEGNNKIPPVLKSYPLPKFDFDDSLHGSLRFDSLVESEVFLGIESNEDHHWIEDFSRGGSAIRFSSTTSEPSSISRHNNVWSEATSSESVEMLLKSVGQEEIVLLQTNNKESDACDELGCITKQMDSSLKKDSKTPSSFGDVVQTSLSPGEIAQNIFVSGNVDGREHPDLVGGLQGPEIPTSADGGLGNLGDSNVNAMLTDAEATKFIYTECKDSSENKVDMVSSESCDIIGPRISASVIEVDGADSSLQNMITEDNKNALTPLKMSTTTDSIVQLENCNVLSLGGQMINDSILDAEVVKDALPGPCYFPKAEFQEEANTTEAKLDNIEEHSCSMQKTDPSISENVSVIDDQSKLKIQKVSEMGSEGNIISEMQEIVETTFSELVNKKLQNRHGVSLLQEDQVHDCSLETVDESGKRCTSDNLTTVCASAEFLCERDSEVHVSSDIAHESLKGSETKMATWRDDVHKLDVYTPMEEKNNAALTTGSVNADIEVSVSVQIGAGPSTCVEERTDSELMVAVAAPMERRSVDNVLTCTGNGDIQDAINNRSLESPSLVLSSTHSDKEKNLAVRSSYETSPLDVSTSSHLATEEDSYSSIIGQMSCPSDQTLSALNLCNAETHSEPKSMILEEAKQGCTKEKEECPVLSDLTAKRGHGDELLNKIDGKLPVEVDPGMDKEKLGPENSALQECCQDIDGNGGEKNEVVMVSVDTGLSNPIISECGKNVDVTKPASNSPANCGSVKHSKDETDKFVVNGSSDQGFPASKADDVDAGLDKLVFKELKQSGAISDGKGISVLKAAKASESVLFTVQVGMQVAERSPSTSRVSQSDVKTTHVLPRESLEVSDVVPHGGSQGNSKRKARRSSGKASGKEATKKGNLSKESASGCIERREKISSVSRCLSATPSSVLPDLNSSSSPAAVLQQPFTDIQQVQLRAQIFVYGALIQGTAPDEAYMISAFGRPDGGRSTWEKSWRLCIERLHGQKSHPVTPQTPLLSSHSGSGAPDQANKQGVRESKVSSSSGRANGKGTPTIACPMVPFSSPLWSLSTPSAEMLQPSGVPRGPVVDFQRAFSPLHSHQNTPSRNLVGHNPSWISQSSLNGPWVASPQTAALDASARFPVQSPATEHVQLTSVKDSSVLHPSASIHVSPVPAGQRGFSTVHTGASHSTGVTNISTSSGQPAKETKSRRRKKPLVSENLGQMIKPSQSQTEPICMPYFFGQPPCSMAITSAIGFTAKTSVENPVTSSSALPSNDLRKVTQDAGRRAILPDEALGKVKEARVQAEEASALAAVAVNHSQEIWNWLDIQRKSGFLPDIETKLASAAVAIAVAAAVAKAAAAAANVASNAALQAKLMADEAAGGRCGDNCQSSATSLSDAMKSFGKATSISILKGDDGVNSSSAILVAAKDTARRRVEAASAASKHAENVDAIVKAAELAAEAVSQAGKIVTMSDPLPLAELLAAGPEGYWKVAQVPSEPASKSQDVGTEILKIDSAGVSDTSASVLKQMPSNKREMLTIGNGNSSASKEMSDEDHMRLIDVFSGTGAASLKDARGRKLRKASDSAKTIRVVPESEMEAKSINDPSRCKDMFEPQEKQDSIQEGSQVEVFKDGDELKAAWFTAHVISLNEGKAYVCYTELTTSEGAEKLKEWVELKSEGDVAPKIRIARPISAMPFEGTRKRRRSAMGDSRWSVGDKVDAWIRDSWCEGVITEKNNKDETVLTVHFPAHEETAMVRAWHLRPSLTWKDGEWIEWSSLGENRHSSCLGDIPQEKRPRVLSPAVLNKGKDTTSKSADSVESDKPEEPTLLKLSADEKIFNIGKSTKDGKPSTLRMTRTELQKERSRVVIGVPKPGKKRKFMEVSKHYDADRSGKPNDSNDSVKFAKYLMPQGSSRGWKYSTKPASNDRQAVLSKPKVSKSGKLQNFSGRSNSLKDHSSGTSDAATDAITITNKMAETKDSENLVENTLKKTHMEFQSVPTSKGAAQGPILFSSLTLSSDSIASKGRSTSTTKFERASKGKLAPASGKLGKIEEDRVLNDDSAKSTTDIVEPRRSNRRIQPTSRLLEGLQTSLIVSKLPSVSHDKGLGSRSTRGNSHG